MTASTSSSANDKAIRAYHQQHSDREGALSNAFFELLRATVREIY